MVNAVNETKQLKVLHIEDSPRDAEIIRERLIDGGFSMQWDWAAGEQEFSGFLHGGQYDIILADYQLPGFDAPAALKLAQTLAPNVPFICVSGAIGEDKAVELLKQGATDYVTKARLDKLPLAVQRALGEVEAHTARRLAEEALRESEKKYRLVFDNANDAIMIHDEQRRILEVNPLACERLGYTHEELTSMTVEQVDTPDEAAHLPERGARLMEFGRMVFETVHQRKDGSPVPTEVSSCRIEWDDQPAVMSICRDITERKQAEEGVKNLHAQLQQAQKMEAIGTLAGGIAHDFNNILGAILGYAELAQEDSPVGSMLRKDIDQVVKASHRAKDLVKQILAFSRQVENVRQPIQPALIVREAVKMLRSSLPSTIAITQNIDMDAGLILADPTQIHQIVMNLGSNALHAMEETGGTLSISLQKKALATADIVSKPGVRPGEFIQLSVGDTGAGIAPELWDKIFDPYFTTKEIGKGTGMGLSIIHGIVKSYGGCVFFQSHPGKGTVFEVMLPIVVEEVVVEAKPAEVVQFGNERILYVDDEELLAEMGKSMLERLGYQVTVRSSSLEALTTFQNQPEMFDLVITDQTMPGMTGSDLARRIMQIRPFMPIILCTGYSNLISEEKAKSLGIKGFAMKPLARKSISGLIREVLDGGRS